MHLNIPGLTTPRMRKNGKPVSIDVRKRKLRLELRKKKGVKRALHYVRHPVVYGKFFYLDAILNADRQKEQGIPLGIDDVEATRVNVLIGIPIAIANHYLASLGFLEVHSATEKLDYESLGVFAHVAEFGVKAFLTYVPTAYNWAVRMPRTFGVAWHKQSDFPYVNVRYDSEDKRGKGAFSAEAILARTIDYTFKKESRPLNFVTGGKWREWHTQYRKAYADWRGENGVFDAVSISTYFTMKNTLDALKSTPSTLLDMTPSSLDDVFDDKPYKHD